ncbi:MAG: TIGR03545 family protein [Thermodesulfobacteriota bacterium]
MSRFIRLSGLVVFAAIVAVVAGVWFLVVDAVVKSMVQSAGTKAVGARVELESADLSLLPLGLELTGLEVTNPEKPMRNAVAAESIRMKFDTSRLIRGKKIIEDMAVTGMEFDTQRESSGALPKRKKPDEKKVSAGRKLRSGLPELPSVSAESARKILENEDLSTVDEAEELKSNALSARQEFEKRLEDLPDEQTFRQHKQRLSEIRESGKSGGLLGAAGTAGEVRQVKKDIQADLDKLRRAKKDISETKSWFREDFRKLQNAPARDARKLAQKYSLSAEGIANMSALIFGPKYAEGVETALTWYMRLSPYVSGIMGSREDRQKPERREGVDVSFDTGTLPEYWVKTAEVSASLAGGELSGRLKDISSDQKILGRPLAFDFSATGIRGSASLDTEGSLDRTDPDKSEDFAVFELRQYPIKNLQFIDRDDFSVLLESGGIDAADGKIRIEDGLLSADITAGFSSAGFEVKSGEGGNLVAEALADTLSGISSFEVTAQMEGSPYQPEIRIGSDIDGRLKAGLKQAIDRRRAELENELKKVISSETKEALKDAESGITGLESVEEQLQKRLNTGSDVLPG